MLTYRKANCPNCGAPIEFHIGSSAACICAYCRFSVIRGDKSLEALGKIADLLPTAPFLNVGDEGEVAGRSFRVGGRLQLDHGEGPWDEWYVAFTDGEWAWVAQAQGQVYVTQPVQPPGPLPPWEATEAGRRLNLPGFEPPLTVTQRGGSALLSAEGELPFPAIPLSSGRYVDAEGPDGAFATVDYGDGSEPPTLYFGRRHPLDALKCTRRGLGPEPVEQVEAERLECPTCGAPISIALPATTQNVTCGSCHALLDREQGALHLLEQLSTPATQQWIPLGAKGTLFDEEVLVVGFTERITEEEGTYYSFCEYLLHAAAGFRYLVEYDGHFLYTWPASVGDVALDGKRAHYQGRTYKRFSAESNTVRTVLGEFYYQVRAGNTVQTQDYICPPHMLSHEQSGDEHTWSHGEYITGKDVWRGLNLPDRPPRARGVGAAQPNPHKPMRGLAIAAALLLALLVTHVVFTSFKSEADVVNMGLTLPSRPAPTVAPPEATRVTEPFEVQRGPTTLQVRLETNARNAWVGLQGALVNDKTGDVRQFYVTAEEWHGGSGDSAYQEGSGNATAYLGAVQSGRYSMRFLPEWGRGPGSSLAPPSQVAVHVKPGRRSPGTAILLALLLVCPAVIRIFRFANFDKRRWQQATFER